MNLLAYPYLVCILISKYDILLVNHSTRNIKYNTKTSINEKAFKESTQQQMITLTIRPNQSRNQFIFMGHMSICNM